MKCVNCGNDNPATLWDEGATIYCSIFQKDVVRNNFGRV